jgi:competence protein ComEA
MTRRKIPVSLTFGAALFLAFAAAAPATKNPPAHPIDINLASAKELEELPGVGPTTAKAIIQFRTKTGRFQRVEDLLAIRGISETKLAKMRPYITVGAPPPKTSLPAKKSAPPPVSNH